MNTHAEFRLKHAQRQVFTRPKRFRVLVAGRRFGKHTSRYQRRTFGTLTDWSLIREFFSQLHGQAVVRIKAATVNPGVRNRVNVLNSRSQNAAGETRFYVDPKCKELIADLERVCWRADSFGQPTAELDKSDRMRTHTSDALGHYLAQVFVPRTKSANAPTLLF